MPDVHAGAGAVIGFTSSIGEKVIPNVIGVDIGCGVYSCNIGKVDLDFNRVDEVIRNNIPSGFSVRSKLAQRYVLDRAIKDVSALVQKIDRVVYDTKQDLDRVMCSLGTLGGGNHFIEIGEDEEGNRWLTIHTGSRNFGLKIANFHQSIAKSRNPYGDLSYLVGEDAEAYYQDMKVAQEFAEANRKIIALTICKELGVLIKETVESVHNYINFSQGIVRKGAISAANGEKVIIPWNMRDGLIIGVGKGNEDWNCSAPHGAGRVMGRGEAKRTLDVELFKKSMEGVWTSCVSESTLDESPFVYKEASVIEALLEPTVEVIHRVKPLYNFKASGD
jgi:RNA-splicing ligase RtcB